MEELKIKEFIGYGYGYGYGDGSGFGFGDGSGFGYGNGNGYGDGSGYGNGYGDGYGYGSGFGNGYGYGSGDGYGSGSGFCDGSGSGSSSGYGIKSINGDTVYSVDGVKTIITSIKNNIAKGFILNTDFCLSPCYIVKSNSGLFAHGKTLHKAQEALQEKLFEGMGEDERIDMFISKFPNPHTSVKNQELFDWHNKLTGSCLMGREQFVKNNSIDLSGNMSVYDFIELTKDSYGRDIILKLKRRYENEKKEG